MSFALAMRGHHSFLISFLVLWYFASPASGGSFCHELADEIRTNPPPYEIVEAPHLLDTNNVAPKLTGSKLAQIRLRPAVEVAGIRVGMKVDDVVARWGKPRTICLGPTYCLLAGTNPASCVHLSYSDDSRCTAQVVSEIGGDRVITIRLGFPILGTNGLPRTGMADCVRALGEPTRRSTWPVPRPAEAKTPSRYDSYLLYEKPLVAVGMFFWGEDLSGVDLSQRVSVVGEGKPIKTGRGPTNGLSQ